VEGRLTGEMKVIDLLISSMHAEERSWLRRPILVKMPGPDSLTLMSSSYSKVDQAACERSTAIVRDTRSTDRSR
jgi:hypothetical protein